MAKSRQSIEAGRASVVLDLTDSEFQKKLVNVERTMKRWGRTIRDIGVGLTAVGGIVTGAFTAGLVKMLAYGDQLDKMAVRTGVAVEKLSALKFAAEQSGTSLEVVGNVLARMQRRIANAASGTGPAVKAMQKLGLSAKEITQLDVVDQFLAVADAMQRMENEGLANQQGFEILGEEIKALEPLLAAGADGVKALMDEARELGVTLTGKTTKGAAQFADDLNILKMQSDALLVSLGAVVAEALGPFVELLKEVLPPIMEWVSANPQLVSGLFAFAGAVTVLGVALAAFGVVMSAASAAAITFGISMGAVLGPLALVAALVAAIAAGVSDAFDNASKKSRDVQRRFAAEMRKVKAAQAKAAASAGPDNQQRDQSESFEKRRLELIRKQMVLLGRMTEEQAEIQRLREQGYSLEQAQELVRLEGRITALKTKANADTRRTIERIDAVTTRARTSATADITSTAFLEFGQADRGVASKQLSVTKEIAANTSRTVREVAELDRVQGATLT